MTLTFPPRHFSNALFNGELEGSFEKISSKALKWGLILFAGTGLFAIIIAFRAMCCLRMNLILFPTCEESKLIVDFFSVDRLHVQHQ